jgi:hypothetical protein
MRREGDMRERSGRGERLAERTVWINISDTCISVDKTICRGIDRDIGADMFTSCGHRHTHRHM